MAKRVRRFRPRQMPPDPQPAPPPVPPAVDRAWGLVSSAQAEQPQPGKRRILRPRDPESPPVKIVLPDEQPDEPMRGSEKHSGEIKVMGRMILIDGRLIKRGTKEDPQKQLAEIVRYGELIAQNINISRHFLRQRHVNVLRELRNAIDELIADWG